MKPMTSAEVRSAFLDFFEEYHHKHVPSSPLIPANDPTLLFTNAGMVQFKDVFLGLDKRDYKRATTSQKAMRVSGKHSDLENVGPSLRHHTFFEMLGNFSFGDYFKRDAIRYAYTLLTEVYQLPKDRLAFTVFQDDDEAYDIWVNDIGVDPKRVARMGFDTNFWQMADTGPCGPTSEIHWDKTPELGEDGIIDALVAEDERFLELWNLVFMQYNRRQADPDNTRQYDDPLPAPGVDTGMGLERVVSVIQGKISNYETDLFMPIIEATQRLTGDSDEARDANIVPYRVIADHVRAAVFMIADGILPGAKKQAAVCRLVIRRAARFGAKLGFTEPFLATIADAVIDVMGGHYPELVERADAIKRAITKEEVYFSRTLTRGLDELNALLDDLAANNQTQLAGESAFYLKATLGLPYEVIKDVVEERGYTLDAEGFDRAEQEHSIASGGGKEMGTIAAGDMYNAVLTDLKNAGKLGEDGVVYNPYNDLIVEDRVLAIIVDGQRVERAMTGDKVEIVLGYTPFYVESGGQISDTGVIVGDGWQIEIEDMQRPVGGLVVHIGEVVEGTPQEGDDARAEVAITRREDIERNHTATHLLHAALRAHLGTHVQQRGSLVAPDRLRFDFLHDAKVSPEALRTIQDEVNDIILKNYVVYTAEKTLDEARAAGAMALFGEKYGEVVRTVSIENDDERPYSLELCGGTHVQRTGDIAQFLIVSEGSVSAGIRRVEAITGRGALNYVENKLDALAHVADQLGATLDQVPERVESLQAELNAAKKQIERLQREGAKSTFDQLINTQLETINGKQALVAQIDNIPADTLREISDWFRNAVSSGVMVLGTISGDKPQIVVAVTDDLTKQGVHAGNLIKQIAAVVGGGGGGRPTMAQAGGRDSAKLPEALETARTLIAEALQNG